MAHREDVSRDLLFGLLALQNGMVTRDQLVGAFGAWTGSPRERMVEILAAGSGLDPAERALIEALAETHLKRHGGDAARSLAALEIGRSTRESLALVSGPELEETLAQVGVASIENDSDANRTGSYAVGTATSDGQRFRILRPHARGGLGVVFVALDSELNRQVALKQILESHADDPTSRARFMLEAEVTGGLEHPGIVPVYGLGTYGDGRPYYAMRFIEGDSLKEAIDRFHNDERLKSDSGDHSLELHKLLRRFTDVCNAIQYAHSRGVLHRDIKPGNVIVGRHGETLVVDWGLAKPIAQAEPHSSAGRGLLVPSTSSGSAETLPGSALGTPAYMSPEQAQGQLDRMGPRSDVYSLGATLYCLLTGRAPFNGNAVDVIHLVQRGEFPAPRQCNASIDRALEAVCVKAMAFRPEDRYESCRALVEEIDRWMADEPTSAWREPLSRRARRWARRNRTAVAVASVAVLAGIVGLSAVLAVQARANSNLTASLFRETEANGALASANAELDRSRAAVQTRYDLAVEAIKTFHTGVSEDFLLKQDQFKELRDRLLKSASDFYGKLGATLGNETDRASRAALGQANFELAELTSQVGSKQDALEAHRRLLLSRRAMAGEPGAGTGTKADVSESLTAVAWILEQTGNPDEAERVYREAESLLADLVRQAPQSRTPRAALATCRSRLAWLLHVTGKSEEAVSVLRRARADQEAIAALPGVRVVSEADLAFSSHRLGTILASVGKPAEAETEFRAALATLERLSEREPAVAEFQRSLAQIHANFGSLLSDLRRTAEAETEYRKALALQEKLSQQNPAVTSFRAGLSATHNALGILLAETGRRTLAETEYRAAIDLLQKLAEEHPSVVEYRDRLALTVHNLGNLLKNTGRSVEAQERYQEAIALQQTLVEKNPTDTHLRSHLALSHNNLGVLLSEMSRPAEAEAQYRSGLALRKRLVEDNPTVTEFRVHLASSHSGLGWLLSGQGRHAQALIPYNECLSLFRELTTAHPKVISYRSDLANAYVNLAMVHLALGRAELARNEADEGAALYEDVVRRDSRRVMERGGLAEALLRGGEARILLGEFADAAARLRRAAQTFQAMPPREPEFEFLEGCSYALLSSLVVRQGSGVSALEGWPQNAIRVLRNASDRGYRDREHYRNERALDSLRDRDDFKTLMQDLAMPANPFAGKR